MATLYVRSTDGSDADNGSTWALAKATLAGAFAVAAAGDRIWVSDNHAETQASAMTLTSPGTAASPVEVLCGDDAAEPPTALATTATISTTGANAITVGGGHTYYYGITFSASSGGSQANLNFTGSSSGYNTLDTCTLKIAGTATGSRIQLGTNSSSLVDTGLVLVNSTIQLSNASQAVTVAGPVDWQGGSLAGTAPTGGLFRMLAGGCPLVRLRGVDLNLLGLNPVISATQGTGGGVVSLENCKLDINASPSTGTYPGPGQVKVFLDNCAASDVNHRRYRESYEGYVFANSSITRTGGASDGTTAYSWEMGPTNPNFHVPLYTPEFVKWNAATGASMTATVEIIYDSATNLQDDEVWLEAEYQGTSGIPKSSFVSDRIATVLTTPADQASSTATWGGTGGMANPNKQKLVVTFTPQEIGFVRCRVALATAAVVVFVDPYITLA